MGYYITLHEAVFRIPAERKSAALDALRAMWEPERHGAMTGYEIVGGARTAHYYAWMNNSSLRFGACESFEQGMRDWGWPVDVDADGNVIGISFENEKIGDEFEMLKAIAPYVDAGSYLTIHGEDGVIWRWWFDGHLVTEHEASVTFEGP